MELLRAGARLTPDDLVAFLATRRILLPGMELDCPRCRHGSFYPPKELDDVVRCPRCAHTFALGPALVGDPLRLRLSGLFDEPRDRALREGQPPAIPVLLTLLLLSEWHGPMDGSIFEVSHDLAGAAVNPCETDIIAVSYGSRPTPHTHILIGECKGRGRVETDDVSKLAAVADAIRSSGVECDLVFSTTRPEFSPDELGLLRAHVRERAAAGLRSRPPILLTLGDLETERFASSGDARQFSHQGFPGLVGLSRARYFSENSDA